MPDFAFRPSVETLGYFLTSLWDCFWEYIKSAIESLGYFWAFHRDFVWLFAAIVGAIGLSETGRAQEAVRASIAGAAAAEARHRASATIGYYNIEVGPTMWSFGSRLRSEYNDNVGLVSGTNRESDEIFSPSVNTKMLWPVTEKNSLNLTLGAGYAVYVKNSKFDRLFISPGSEIAFDVFVGDFWISLHDRYSISETSSQDPTVANSGNYSQFQNAAGFGVSWDLNNVIVRFGYDHNISFPLTGSGGSGQMQSGTSSDSDVGFVNAGYAIGGGMLAGIETGGGVIRNGGSDSGTNSSPHESVQWNAGAFVEKRVSEYISVKGGAGFTENEPLSNSKTSSGQGASTGIYGHLDIQHRVNKLLEYTFSGGRLISSGYAGGTVDLYFAHINSNWKIFQKTTVITLLSYDRGSSVNTGAETFQRLGVGFDLGRRITQKMNGSLGYQLYSRTSNQANRSYVENMVHLDLDYKF